MLQEQRIRRPWIPLPGPQTRAYLSEAQQLYYGGAAGGGKTDLLLGLAATQHQKSLILRRELPQLREIEQRSRELFGGRGRFNENLHLWRFSDGRLLELGGCQHEKDKLDYQGRPHDFYGFDELPQFSESQVRFITGWNRTTVAGQRCRWVGAGNPPTTPEGEWVIRYWSPWLDGQHPNPAELGELRWFAVIDDQDREVDGPTPFEYKGELIEPVSRTFIPAALHDNPYLMRTGYRATLAGMPEPLRSQMLYGDFTVGHDDDPWQVIPTAWVIAAQERWKATQRPVGVPLTAVGVDVARGGKDKTVLARRYDNWFPALEKHKGKDTPDGPTVVGLISRALTDGGYANIDITGGWGSSAYDHAAGLRLDVRGINFANASQLRDRTGKLKMANVRAALYWSFREALDPEKGDNIALPPDSELLADLCAPRWIIRTSGVYVELKEDIIKRIGRSPDCGDAVILANWQSGGPGVTILGNFRQTPDSLARQPGMREEW